MQKSERKGEKSKRKNRLEKCIRRNKKMQNGLILNSGKELHLEKEKEEFIFSALKAGKEKWSELPVLS